MLTGDPQVKWTIHTQQTSIPGSPFVFVHNEIFNFESFFFTQSPYEGGSSSCI